MTRWEIELEDARTVPISDRAELAKMLETYSAQREERPFIVTLIGPPGALGFGVGRHRTVLEYLDPPYRESRGSVPEGDIVVYFFGGDWTELGSEAEVEWTDAKRAILEFFDKGTLSSAIRWVEV